MRESCRAPDYYVLEHHGIKNQKWGVRRYQNSDKRAHYNKLIDSYMRSLNRE